MLPPVDELERRVADAFELWRVPPGPPVRVRWNQRLHSTAGRAFAAEHRIELNPTLLGGRPDALRTVLVHEAAHVAAQRLFGEHVQAHGRHWRALMRLAGLPPEITHTLPVRQRSRRSYVYLRVCDACGDRRIARVVRYGACRCGARERFLVMRAAASAGGLSVLRAMPVSEVRRRCASATAR